MPALLDHQSAQVTKLLLLGDSGAGKTGSLASLAEAGWNLHINDFDNGLDILRNVLTPAAQARVFYESIQDSREKRGVNVLGAGNQIIGRTERMVPVGDAWPRFLSLLDKWPATGESVYKLGPKDVLVNDSLTFMSKAALNFILKVNNRHKLNEYDYGDAQTMLEDIFATLYDHDLKCNVILIAHIDYQPDGRGVLQGMPAAPGKKLSPKIGRYFNSVLRVKTIGKERQITTTSDGTVELKTSAPSSVKPSYPLASGLAQYFRDVQGPPPESA